MENEGLPKTPKPKANMTFCQHASFVYAIKTSNNNL